MKLKIFGAITCLLGGLPGPALAQNEIQETRVIETVKTLTSDQFEGRAPGTAGEDRTIGYLIGRFQAMGLEPGGVNGSWTQPVPLLRTKVGKTHKARDPDRF